MIPLRRRAFIGGLSYNFQWVSIDDHLQIVIIKLVWFYSEGGLSRSQLLNFFEHFLIKVWLQLFVQILNGLLEAKSQEFVVWFFRKLQIWNMIYEFDYVLLN